MNSKQFFLLLAALIILGGAGLMVSHHSDQSWNTSEGRLGQKVLPDFQPNNVACLHVKGADDLDLVKKNDRWVVKERNDYPANFSQIKDVLLKIQDLKIAMAEPIGPSQLGRMHLADPGTGANAATLVEFKDAQGKTFDSLLLGKKHTREVQQPSRSPYGDMDRADGRFVMLKSDPKEVLTVSDPLTTLDDAASGWLDKDFFKIEKIKSISFVSTNAADSWSLSCGGESAPWVLASAKAGEVLDTNKVSSINGTLSYPSFVDVAPDNSPAKTGLDKPLVVTITTFDDFAYTLKVGAKNPQNNYNVQIAVTAGFPTKRTPAKDEKPDAAKLLDKEFADKLKTLQDKFAQEKALGDATYLMSSWLIDPFIRHRAELMVEKKDETKEAATTPASIPEGAPGSGVDLGPVSPTNN